MATKKKLIFSHNLCRYLLSKGFTIIDIGYSKKDPEKKLTVYIFKDSQSLQEAINEYSKQQHVNG